MCAARVRRSEVVSCNPLSGQEAELKRGAIESNSTTRLTAVLGTSAEIHGAADSTDVLHTLGVGGTSENGVSCPINATLFVLWATS
jgi:hypothetical protein